MSQVDEIKERLNIVDVVSEYVKLEKSGRNYKGKSPFTNEKTPSFFVSPDKNMFYCFSSNKGGDIFTFIEEMERVDFMGALKILSDKAGVELKRIDPEKKNEKDRSYAVLEAAARYYQKNFVQNKDVFRYMVGRGLHTETLKMFRIGFAEDSWRGCLDFLKGEMYTEREIIDAGLAIPRGDGKQGAYDRFRGRIMFPVCDVAGRVVGFSGRVFSVSPTDGDNGEKTAKYINTPETDLYHKSRILYGFDKAKEHIRKENTIILVEGQMDVLASHQAEIQNAVAVSGTSLTEEHLKIAARFTDNVLLALDGDRAGRSASDKSARSALSLGMNVFAVSLPEGNDPADLVKEDPRKWQDTVMNKKEYVDFRIGLITGVKDHDPSREIKETIFPHVFATHGSIRKDRILKKISDAIGSTLESMRDEYTVWKKDNERDSARGGFRYSDPSGHFEESALHSTTMKEKIERRLLGLLEWQEGLQKPDMNTALIRSKYEALLNQSGSRTMKERPESEGKKMALEAEFLYEGKEEIEEEAKDLLRSFESELIHEELEKLSREIGRKDTVKEEGIESVMEQYQKLLTRKESLRREKSKE